MCPMMMASVCHVNDALNITCTTPSVQFIGWSIMVVNERGTLEEIIGYSTSTDRSQQVTPMMVNSTSFTFMRSSAQYDVPLISTLSIDKVSIGLNGTVVHCMEADSSSMMKASESTTIHIIGANSSELASQ